MIKLHLRLILFITGVSVTLIYLLIFFIAISKNFVFDGKLTVVYDFENESPFISLLKPRGRVDQTIKKDKNNDYYQTILIDPVYFDVKYPRNFNNAKVTLKYKNEFEPIIELGISKGEGDEKYIFKSIENKLLDKLIQDPLWNKIIDGQDILFQKEKKFTSINQFLKNIPFENKIATYNYLLPFSYKIKDYKKSEQGISIYKSLRGEHTLLTYVGKDENLDFIFNLQDVNRIQGKDTIKIRVFKQDTEIYQKEIIDDGIVDDSAFMSKPFDNNIFLEKPGEGVYKIKIETSDDIFIRNINTKQYLLVFENFVYLADNVGYLNDKQPNRYLQTTIFSTVEKLNAITSHQEAFQKIIFGNKEIDVNEKHTMFTKSNTLSERKIYLEEIISPKNDIKLVGKGLFVFDKTHFFDPLSLNITGDPNLNLDLYNIKYVLARYKSPIKNNNWNEKTLEFDLKKLNDIDNQQRFVISFPYSNGEKTKIDISEIKIEFEGDKINFKDILKTIRQLAEQKFKIW